MSSHPISIKPEQFINAEPSYPCQSPRSTERMQSRPHEHTIHRYPHVYQVSLRQRHMPLPNPHTHSERCGCTRCATASSVPRRPHERLQVSCPSAAVPSGGPCWEACVQGRLLQQHRLHAPHGSAPQRPHPGRGPRRAGRPGWDVGSLQRQQVSQANEDVGQVSGQGGQGQV